MRFLISFLNQTQLISDYVYDTVFLLVFQKVPLPYPHQNPAHSRQTLPESRLVENLFVTVLFLIVLPAFYVHVSLFYVFLSATISRLCHIVYQKYIAPKPRSEEHTSELQSRFDLVCRLLLEKKNMTTLTH